MPESGYRQLDCDRDSQIVQPLREFFEDKVIGQERVAEELLARLELSQSGFTRNDRPILCVLFLGPSGVGKTLVAECLAEFYHGNSRAITKIACAELSEPHTISKLIGSPPGYIGFDAQEKGEFPMLSQWNLDKHGLSSNEGAKQAKKRDALNAQITYYKEKLRRIQKVIDENENLKDVIVNDDERATIDEQLKQLGKMRIQVLVALIELNRRKKIIDNQRPISIVLFDEIEKAHPNIYPILLEIMDKGRITLSNGKEVDFRNSFIILTSNVGSREIEGNATKSHSIGFAPTTASEKMLDRPIYKSAMEAAKRVFAPEFRGRLDSIEVFRLLTKDELMRILENHIKDFLTKLAKEFPVLLQIDESVKRFVLAEATDKVEFGARLLRHKFESLIVKPLSKLKNLGQINLGDTILVEMSPDMKNVVFSKNVSETAIALKSD